MPKIVLRQLSKAGCYISVITNNHSGNKVARILNSEDTIYMEICLQKSCSIKICVSYVNS